MSAGGGKAQPLYSKVLTKDGWKTMGDIQVGDEVITPDNKTSKVLNTFLHDNKSIYKVTTHSGNVVYACNEHLWKVSVTENKKGTTEGVFDTDQIINLMENNRKVYLPVSQAVDLGSENDFIIDPYVMGCLLYTSPSPRD